MCVVSMIGDDWAKRMSATYPNFTSGVKIYDSPSVSEWATKEEVESLRKEVESLKKLLKAAKIYDAESHQPDCHVDEKVSLIKKLAKELDVDLEGLFDD